MEAFRLLIVTGMSGAGKTQVLQALEDMGYLCIEQYSTCADTKIE